MRQIPNDDGRSKAELLTCRLTARLTKIAECLERWSRTFPVTCFPPISEDEAVTYFSLILKSKLIWPLYDEVCTIWRCTITQDICWYYARRSLKERKSRACPKYCLYYKDNSLRPCPLTPYWCLNSTLWFLREKCQWRIIPFEGQNLQLRLIFTASSSLPSSLASLSILSIPRSFSAT